VLLSVFFVFPQNSTAVLKININELKSGNNSSSNSQTKKNSDMAQVPTPEIQLSNMANNLTDKKPVGFLDLLYEIRLVIYHYWFSRPIGIVPIINYYTRKPTR
jgi:hypothetical protein